MLTADADMNIPAQVLPFMQNVVDQLTISGQTQSRVANTMFSTTANVAFNFETYNTKAEIKAAIGATPYPSAATNTPLGIDLARTDVCAVVGHSAQSLKPALVLCCE